MSKLPSTFFTDHDVVYVAQSLLGKLLFTRFNGELTGGKIVETEAYRGPEDKGCHAYNNRRTARTEIMFWEGGHAYITLCYGIHHLFNVVTGQAEAPQAVLIRAIEPVAGIPTMLKRRGMTQLETRITAGPGALSKALGITTDFHGQYLLEPTSPIWLEEGDGATPAEQILASPRVGIAYAEEWKATPWRFRVRDSRWTSPAK